MEQTELDKRAYAGAPLPDGLPYDQTLYYLMMSAACVQGKAQNYSPEQWRNVKHRIMEHVREYKADRELGQYYAKVQLETGASRAAFRKAKTDAEALEAACRLVEALDNVPVLRNKKPPA